MESMLTRDLPNWMSTLPESVLDKSLSEIAIPGTHNSFSYHLDPASEMGPDVPDAVKTLGAIGKGIVYKWSVTQSQTFSEQLESGIRYFDLRAAGRTGSPDIFFLHGLYGNKVEPGLAEVNSFLDAHSKEVVILDFNHFYRMTLEHHQKLMETLSRVFGNKLCMFVGVENATLHMMWENNLQVIVLYHHKVCEENPLLWPGPDCIRSLWANTPSVPKLVAYLNEHYLQHRDDARFHVCQGVLTPDTGYILGHLTGSVKTDLAQKVVPPFISWIKNKPPGRTGVNVCITDFTEVFDCEFSKIVIRLNY